MRTPPRGQAALRFVAVACMLVALPLLAPAAAAGQTSPELLPDLVADPPLDPYPPEVTRLSDGAEHLLVRFDGSIHNAGRGPLEIRGSQPAGGVMTVTGQRIYRANGTYRDDNSRRPQIQFENSDGHRHWHLRSAARYTLWDEAGSRVVAPAAKVGFCLLDSEHVDGFGPASAVYTRSGTQYCREAQPNASQVFEGISAGWVDWYAAQLPFQWVDASDVPPGRYRIGAQMDPDDFVIESNEQNNGPVLGRATVTLPGYAASAVSTSATGAQGVALPATAYDATGAPVFRIESPPAHGSLNVPAGVAVQSTVVYTPQRGFAGQDAFTYSVRDSGRRFPLRPSSATVSVSVPAPVARKARRRLLVGLRWSRRGRFVTLRARATRSGVLRIALKRRAKRLGSCRKRARAERRFACRIRVRRHASLRRGTAVVTLLVAGKARATDSFRVPRRLRP